MSEEKVIEALRGQGPVTGSRLLELTGLDALSLWRVCRTCASIRWEHAGRRYLRLDRVVEEFARLSPSIRREFLTYTVLGLKHEADRISEAAEAVRRNSAAISHEKINLAREIAVAAVEETGQNDFLVNNACFIIAGDVTYDMAHRVPRPEKSTGEMVRGSDLDIVIIAENNFPPKLLGALDQAVYRKKHFMLVHPDYREEVDYLIKDLDRVREQARFDHFEAMVACKIMDEGRLLYGSRRLFGEVKRILDEQGIPARLRSLEAQAVSERQSAEYHLLTRGGSDSPEEISHLFYTQEEGEEIY